MKRWMTAWCLGAALAACDDGGGSSGAGGAEPGADAAVDAGIEVGPCGATPESVGACVDMTRYAQSLELVARPRAPGSPHWQAVQDECAAVFEAAGFTVERDAYGTGTNVIGYLPGTDRPDEWVLLSAHYDHVGECAGADDNASGVAGVLEAARALGTTRFARTIVVACWDQEEFGKAGSNSYAARVAAAGPTLAANYVLEMIGYRDATPNSQFLPAGFDAFFADAAAQVDARMNAGDFIALIGHEGHGGNDALVRGAEAVGLPLVPVIMADNLRVDPSFSDLRRSDHEGFWLQDLPAVMITDTANFRNPNYHCSRGDDDIASVDMEFAVQTVQATVHAMAEVAEIVTRADAEPSAFEPPAAQPYAPVCDPLAQDCPDGQRCVIVFEGGWQERCVARMAEPTPLGEVCEPAPDSCEGANLCAFWGLPRTDPQERRCRPLCRTDAQCGDGENCFLLGGQTRMGGCVPRCDPVANDCPDGMRCTAFRNAEAGRSATVCLIAGDGAIGERCSGDSDCAEGECTAGSGVQTSVCRAYCRSDDDCGEGLTCFPVVPQDGVPAGTGTCLPSR